MDGLGLWIGVGAFCLGMFIHGGLNSIALAISDLARTLRKVEVNLSKINVELVASDKPLQLHK